MNKERQEWLDGRACDTIRQRTARCRICWVAVKHKFRQLGWCQIIKSGDFSFDAKGDRESL